jgi:hypothetical protein
VYSLDLRTGNWLRSPDLPHPRHGLGVAAADGFLYAIGGGPQPGLTVSDANDELCLVGC